MDGISTTHHVEKPAPSTSPAKRQQPHAPQHLGGRGSYELKPRGEVLRDLTREGSGDVDTSSEASALLDAWRAALFLGEPLGEGGNWYDLEMRALACQILASAGLPIRF